MARNAQLKGVSGLLLLAAFVVATGTGCAARVTTPSGHEVTLGPAEGQVAGTESGSSEILVAPDTSRLRWPGYELRRIGRLWEDGKYAEAIRRAIDLSREMNRKHGRQSAGSDGYRQRDLYDPDRGDGYEDANLSDVLRRARAAEREELD